MMELEQFLKKCRTKDKTCTFLSILNVSDQEFGPKHCSKGSNHRKKVAPKSQNLKLSVGS